MGRSQRHLRYTMGDDSAGSNRYPGEGYEWDWGNTWPSGSENAIPAPFLDARFWNGIPSGWSFSRQGPGTYVTSKGVRMTASDGQARTGHHVWTGTTWAPAGCLIESETRSNLILGSDTPASSIDLAVSDGARYSLQFVGEGSVTLTGAINVVVTCTGDAEHLRVHTTQLANGTALNITSDGDVREMQFELGDTPSSYIPTAGTAGVRHPDLLECPWELLGFDDEMPIDPETGEAAISLAMDGYMSFADSGLSNAVTPYACHADGSNGFGAELYTSGNVAAWLFIQRASGGPGITVGSGQQDYTPGLDRRFRIAARHTAQEINGAYEGKVLPGNTTPISLANVSTANIKLGVKLMGSVRRFRLWKGGVSDSDLARMASA